MHDDDRRLFFGLEVQSPWPSILPEGRVLGEGHRHLTLAFLGNTFYPTLRDQLPLLPAPVFHIGPVGVFNTCLFLPEKDPRVVAWHVQWLGDRAVETYQDVLTAWLSENGYGLESRPFLPHVTMARPPFSQEDWKASFSPLPLYLSALHLYESVGPMRYEPVWSLPFSRPFEPLQGEGGRFLIRGTYIAQLQTHAEIALAFACPALAALLPLHDHPTSVEEVVAHLNRLLKIAAQEVALPFRSVLSEGRLRKGDNGSLEWEMILEMTAYASPKK